MSGSAPIPSFASREDFCEAVYDEGGEAVAARLDALLKGFKKQINVVPTFIGRSPGRVNVVGEHIDYEGYSVLPMAITQDTMIAISFSGENRVLVKNLDPGAPEKAFSTDPDEVVDIHNHSWVNYVQAAYKGVFEFLRAKCPDRVPALKGLNLLVHGTVPQGSGLSSSAALVCSAALAILAVYGLEDAVTQGEVASFTALCEKYVGTESGGMDQAISIMGEKGKAKLVHFKPVRTEDVPLPAGATFVIANSLTRSAKAETAAKNYNMRVVECRLASVLIALKSGIPKEEALEMKTLKEVEGLVSKGQKSIAGAKGDLKGGEEVVVRQLLDKDMYTQEELEAEMGMPLEDLFGSNPSQMRCLAVAGQNGGFNLRDRAVHVYKEAKRVPDFKRVCDSEMSAQQKIQELANIMNDSQASCRDLYQCSCDELDELVKVSREAGALGSRLTGAGWGGCTVSLVEEDKVEDFIATVKREYYIKNVKADKPLAFFFDQKDGDVAPKAGWENTIFASRPGSGGATLML